MIGRSRRNEPGMRGVEERRGVRDRKERVSEERYESEEEGERRVKGGARKERKEREKEDNKKVREEARQRGGEKGEIHRTSNLFSVKAIGEVRLRSELSDST